MPVTKFTVVRERWLRGTGNGLLLDENGMMCCLGFLGEACGIPRESLLRVGPPSQVTDFDRSWPKGLLHVTNDPDDVEMDESAISTEIMLVNDDPGSEAESTRERLLTGLFASIGVGVTFE